MIILIPIGGPTRPREPSPLEVVGDIIKGGK